MRLINILITIILASGAFSGADAQDFLSQLKKHKQGEGVVTVNQSKEIDELVNGKPATAANNAHPAAKSDNGSSVKSTGKKQEPAATPKKAAPEAETGSAQDTDTSKKLMRNGHKVTGYRVQVYSGRNSRADKIKANDVGSRLKTLFPDQPIYVHFYNPRWICRMGNFRTYQEAQDMLNEVKAVGYGQACIVKGQIMVQD